MQFGGNKDDILLFFQRTLLGIRALERQLQLKFLDERSREAWVFLATLIENECIGLNDMRSPAHLQDNAHEHASSHTNRPIRLILSFTASKHASVKHSRPRRRKRRTEPW